MRRPETWLEWFPVFTRYIGLLGVIFMLVIWAVSDRTEPAILTFLGLLIGVGEGAAAINKLASARVPPPPPREEPETK